MRWKPQTVCGRAPDFIRCVQKWIDFWPTKAVASSDFQYEYSALHILISLARAEKGSISFNSPDFQPDKT